MNSYLVQLEDCNKAIQSPQLLKEVFSKLCTTADIEGKNSSSDMSADERLAENQHTLLFLEKKNELEELTQENVALTNKYKDEKADQISVNAALLKRVSSTQPTRHRSTIFRS